jgi:hypothetical protein
MNGITMAFASFEERLHHVEFCGDIWGSNGEYEDDISLCSLVDTDRRFRAAYCFHN